MILAVAIVVTALVLAPNNKTTVNAATWTAESNGVSYTVSIRSLDGEVAYTYLCSVPTSATTYSVNWEYTDDEGTHNFTTINGNVYSFVSKSANIDLYICVTNGSEQPIEYYPMLSAYEALYEKCGDNLYWRFDEIPGDDGYCLEIFGTGDMWDYGMSSSDKAPWFTVIGAERIAQVNITGATSIGSFAFYNCDNLASVSFGNDLRKIGNNSFYNCINLKSINFPDGLSTIGNAAFFNCTAIKEITLPATLSSLNQLAFKKCTSLSKVTIAEGCSLSSLETETFRDCSSLKSIVIPKNITEIHPHAFLFTDCVLKFIADAAPNDIVNSNLINYITNYTPFENVSVTADFKTGKATVDIGRVDLTNAMSYMRWDYGERDDSYFSNFNGQNLGYDISDIDFYHNKITLFWADMVGNTATKVINLTYLEDVFSTSNITYGQKLGDVKYFEANLYGKNNKEMPEGFTGGMLASFTDVTPDAGTALVDFEFTPNNPYAGYTALLKNVPVTVNKLIPTVITNPTASKITYEQTLSDSVLSGGKCDVAGTWSWGNGDMKPNAGAGSYTVNFTPSDLKNISGLSISIPLTVDKRVPDVSGAKASDITYGDTLSKSVITINN